MSSRIPEAIDACIAAVFSGFARIDAKPGYCYRRCVPPLYNFVIVVHSTIYRCFEVDVVSTVFPVWDRQYGTHQLKRATGLPNLRVGSGPMLMEDVPYNYDTQPAQALTVISDELEKYAHPWFAAHQHEVANDQLVQCGLRLIQEGTGSTIPIEELKEQLRKECDRFPSTKWQRRETAILALDLLRWQRER